MSWVDLDEYGVQELIARHHEVRSRCEETTTTEALEKYLSSELSHVKRYSGPSGVEIYMGFKLSDGVMRIHFMSFGMITVADVESCVEVFSEELKALCESLGVDEVRSWIPTDYDRAPAMNDFYDLLFSEAVETEFDKELNGVRKVCFLVENIHG